MTRALLAAALAAALLPAAGCLERTITITSQPPGALVTLNDVEIGRTPVTTGFSFYGTYDVRLRKEGYEPLITARSTKTPIYEYPPFDFVAAAIPARIQTKLVWDFKLDPIEPPSPAQEAALLLRAKELQAMTTPAAATFPPEPAPAPQQP